MLGLLLGLQSTRHKHACVRMRVMRATHASADVCERRARVRVLRACKCVWASGCRTNSRENKDVGDESSRMASPLPELTSGSVRYAISQEGHHSCELTTAARRHETCSAARTMQLPRRLTPLARCGHMHGTCNTPPTVSY